MTARTSMLQITYSNELLHGKEIHVSSNCFPVKASRFEPAGHSFHEVALKLSGCFMDEDEKVEEKSGSFVKEEEQEYVPSADSYSSSKGKKKSKDGAKRQDHYALLGLGNLRYLATEDQIKKSYRQTSLKHHPDKQAALLLLEQTEAAKETKRDAIENRFKAIQEAYEVLMDPVKRRIFDSTDEFDDEIPTDCGSQDFYKVFGPAFLRNGRWSVNQPTPLLGDDNTPLNDVELFYDFWYGFKSWREFPHEDDYDLEDAESRDHKRWMERQNAKLSEKARKEEYTRIRSLVDNAYKRDPRVLKRKELLKAERQKKKEAKFLVKKLQEEEAARVAEEERCKKEEAEKEAAEAAAIQKKNKEKEKKLLRKERTRLRTVSSDVVTQRLFNLNKDDVENLCMSLDMLKLKKLCDDMETQEDGVQAELLKEAVSSIDPEKVFTTSHSQQNGTVKVNGAVKVNGDVSKQKKEVHKAKKSVPVQKADSTEASDAFFEKKKTTKASPSPRVTQEENKSDAVNVSTKVVENGVKENGVTENGVKENGVNLDEDEWSVAQVTALMQALKAFPKEANMRWERVSAAVPGKSVNQCKKQFASLKNNLKTKKK